jgi:hypothetical protein
MSAIAPHVGNGHVVSACNGNAVILVVNKAIRDSEVAGVGDIETIRVVGCGQAITDGIWSIAGRIIETDVGHKHVTAAGDWETVRWVVLNVEVLNQRIGSHFAHNKEMIRPI